MEDKRIKLAETKLAKQVSAYTLIHYDLEFAAQAFSCAAQYSVPQSKKFGSSDYVHSRVAALRLADPILRAGGAVAQLDVNVNIQETTKRALFEAALITYARCFTSGARTKLSTDIFKGALSSSLKFHQGIMQVRHEHIAHSELKQEISVIGFRLVDDPAYGKRPSAVFSSVSGRRAYPDNSVLEKLSDHCRLVDENYVQPTMMEKSKALREQLL